VLVVTGGEVLDGTISDAHTPFITRTLRPTGLRCVRTIVVGDTAEDLQSALEEATQHAQLVLTTGGLGPTANDRTREALSDFTGIGVREHPAALATLARRFGQAPEQLRENLRRQVLVPIEGGFLPNDHGTAVGLIFETAEAVLIALPGPPRELQPMVTDHLVPWVRSRLGLPERGTSVTLRFVGLGQSSIDATLRQQVPLPIGTVTSSRFDGSRVDFTFALPEDTPLARAQLVRLREQLSGHLGRYLYSTNQHVSLEQVAWARLSMDGPSLVLVEAQGPHLASAFGSAELPESAQITSIASRSERELGTVLGLRDAGWEGLSPSQRVETLGKAGRRLTSAAWVLVVGEPVRTAEGRGVVWVALGHPNDQWEVWSLAVRKAPATGWSSVVNSVLDRLRRVPVQPSSRRIATPSTIR
jgi:nicotinamide-nucleotide amidase